MKRIFSLSVMLLIFLSVAAICILSGFKDSTLAFIVPTIVSIIGAAITSCLLLVEAVFGRKVYHYSGEILSIKRKEKTVLEIPRSEVKSMTLIYDVDTDNLYLVSFEHSGKKHYIAVNSSNSDDVLNFIEGIDHIKKKNYWYYIIYLLEVLLV